MDGQEEQGRAIRLVPRPQRRNILLPRRNMVHYRLQNVVGNEPINNYYFVDTNGDSSYPIPTDSYPSVLPSLIPNYYVPSQPGYVAVQPISYIPPQATHIAIPLRHSAPRALPRLVNGNTPRISNGTVSRIANATTPRIRNVTAPRVMNVPAPRIANGTVPRAMRLLSPREPPVSLPQTAYLLAPNGTCITIASAIYTPSTSTTYVTLPSTSSYGTTVPAYPNTSQRIVLSAAQVPNEHVPRIDELEITEVVSSSAIN